MGKTILGILLGLLAGFAVVAGIEYLGHSLFPLHEKLDMTNMANVEIYLDNAPFGALFMVILAHFFGSASAIFTALKVSKKNWAAYVVGVLFFVATVANLFIIPHPTWFTIADVVAIIIAMILVFKYLK